MGRTLLKLLLQEPMKEVNDNRLMANGREGTNSSFVFRTEIISMQRVDMKLT